MIEAYVDRPRPQPRGKTKEAPPRDKSILSRWITPVIAIAAVSLAAVLLYRMLSRYSLDDILASIAAIPAMRIALAGLFAAASYVCLTCFDWMATKYVGQHLPYRYVALASFVSLSIGHNIGFAALSSGAIRYRFYSRYGLGFGDIAKIILFCAVTVGLGLAILGAFALLLQPELAAQITGLPAGAVLAIGIGCAAAAIGYLALAACVRKPLTVRNWTLELPPLRLALGQVIIGPVNFALVAGCLYHTLAGVGEVSYLAVGAVYVIANASSLLAHAPGGLGVIETVVLYLLPQAQFIGALIAFRAIYFLAPLCIGGPLFAITEVALRRRAAAAQSTHDVN